MNQKKENPAGGRGNPEISLAASKIDPEIILSLSDPQQLLQVSRLRRRCAISASMAATISAIVFDAGVRGS
jgi:hypothetical protein